MRVAGAAVLLATMACARERPAARSEAFQPMVVGSAVPVYAVAGLAGDSIRVGPGDSLTVLNVWATWCTSCREEMGDLEALHREFAAAPVRVIGVSVDQGGTDRVRRFVADEKMTFAVAIDAEQRIQQDYGIVGVPETFVIDRRGMLLYHVRGNIRPSIPAVRQALRRGLGAS